MNAKKPIAYSHYKICEVWTRQPEMTYQDELKTYYQRRADELQTAWQNAKTDEEAARLQRELEPLMNWLMKNGEES